MSQDYKTYYKRNLPHYQPIGGIFFVTYRLAFSLPQSIINELKAKRREFDNILKEIPEERQKTRIREYNKRLFGLEDRFLDRYKTGPTWLSNERIAQLVLDSLLFRHQKWYVLYCALVMPNHVHTVLKPLNKKDEVPYALAEITKAHKSFTAHKANKILNRSGCFWQHESYDHWIRDDTEFYRIIKYILNNPVKAGLVEDHRQWRYYWLHETLRA